MIELLATIVLAFIAVFVVTVILRQIADFFKSEGLGQVDVERQRPGISFYGNIAEKKTIAL